MSYIKDINIAGVDVHYSVAGSTAKYSDGRTHLSVTGSDVSLINDAYHLPITSNSIPKYVACGLPVTEILTYGRSLRALEIGTGLSEFTPTFARVSRERVTVAGLENYQSVHRVHTAVVQNNAEQRSVIEKAKVHISRSEVMMNPALIDYREGNFYDSYESLERGPKFDLIVAFLSVFQYPLVPKPETYRMLSSLLTPNGQIFSEYRPE